MKTVNIAGTNRTRTLEDVIADEIRNHGFKTNRMTCILKQKVTEHYPSGRSNNDLFDDGEFGFEDKDYQNVRVAFIDCPIGSTPESVQAKLNALVAAGKFPMVQKHMSLSPILSEDQKSAIAAGLTNIEAIKKSQQVLIPSKANPEVLEPAMFQGHVFYRTNKFVSDYVEDIDTRLAELKELEGASVQVAEATLSMAQ